MLRSLARGPESRTAKPLVSLRFCNKILAPNWSDEPASASGRHSQPWLDCRRNRYARRVVTLRKVLVLTDKRVTRMFRLPTTATAPFCPSEVQGSIQVPAATSWWSKLKRFWGPGLLIAIGYMDPGNWATDIQGGSRFGYTLLWVVVLSSGGAIFLQLLAARLDGTSRSSCARWLRHLPCGTTYPRLVSRIVIPGMVQARDTPIAQNGLLRDLLIAFHRTCPPRIPHYSVCLPTIEFTT
jgi:hypothetical protein